LGFIIKVETVQPLTALTIAGSDSGGGAGIQADLRTFSAFEMHGTCAVTAITAQNTLAVGAVLALDPDLVVAQIESVINDFSVVAVKTGMLAQPTTVVRVAELARDKLLPYLVVDPVLVATSGQALMADGGAESYREALLPLAYVVTPNIREAAVLCDVEVNDVTNLEDMVGLAQVLLAMGPQYVLVKGGHFARSSTGERTPDVLVGPDDVTVFDAARIDTNNDHGTGCSLSAAICAGLGLGRSLPDATRDAKSFVLSALYGARTWQLGQGRGPIDHLGWNP
jgi:hydroxymethylpyrimidine kinase/phosphomethylpyrimidine kinase